MKNFYDTLGITRKASQDEIKKSFRKLALQYHPDRAGKEYTETFQKISEAYNILSNIEHKKIYDDLLSKHNITNIIKSNTDINITIYISIKDAVTGVDVPYQYKKDNNEESFVRISFDHIQDNTKLTYLGYGNNDNPEVKPGNLIITIKIKEDKNFKIANNKKDIEVILYVDYLFAIIGGKKYIDSFIKDEIIVFDIPPNVLDGEIINSENNYGLIDKYGNRGKVIATVKLIPPKISSQKYKALSYINSYIEPENMVYELCKNRK